MTSAAPQFGRVPYAVVTSGVLASLRPGAVKVYLALCAFADDTWTARPGMRRLEKVTGLILSSVSRSVGELRNAGLIVTDSPGNGSAYTYMIVTDPNADRSHHSERPTVRRPANGIRVKRSHTRERSAQGSVRTHANGTNHDRSHAGAQTVRTPAQNRSHAREQNRENREKNRGGDPLRADSPPAMTFPIKGNRQWPLTREKRQQYEQTHPNIDVDRELRKARQWCQDNPKRRKTSRGMPAFLTRWLSRAADDGNSDLTETAPCSIEEADRLLTGVQR